MGIGHRRNRVLVLALPSLTSCTRHLTLPRLSFLICSVRSRRHLSSVPTMFGVQELGISSQLPFRASVTLDELLYLIVPQFPPLYNGAPWIVQRKH